MAIDKVTYAAAKKYTDKSIAGGGAIKGKNCVVDSIMAITGGHRVTFKWTLDDGTVQTGYMDVMDGVDGVDGADGRGVASVDIDANNHLIITYDDGTDHDAGEIKVQGQTIQRNVLPPASASELGNIYQYIGADTSDLVNGYFYQCKSDGVGGYIWDEKPVQRAGGGGTIDQHLDPTSHNAVENMAIAVPIQALQGSMANVKLDITQLQASDLSLRTAIHNLDLLVASKVDKEAGKGLSSNDFTNTEKQKLDKLQPIYLIGSGLNLDGSTLKATGISIPIDTALDPTSANPVQNKAIAVPVQALQGSMVNVKLDVTQLQGSLANKADKTDVTNIQLDVNQLKGSMAGVKSDIGNIQLNVNQLAGSVANAKTDINNIQLNVNQLSGSMVTLKLDVDQLSGSLVYKADKSDLDEWIGPVLADSNGDVTFDDLDDDYAYKLFGENRVVRIDGQPTKTTGTTSGTVKITYKTDAPQNTKCVLRKLKPAVPV